MLCLFWGTILFHYTYNAVFRRLSLGKGWIMNNMATYTSTILIVT